MKRTLTAFATIFAVLFALSAFAQPVQVNTASKLLWDAPADTDLASYQVFYSTTAGTYDLENPVGEVEAAIAEFLILDGNPVEGTTYYAVVRAVDAAGNVSPLSNEVSFVMDSTAPGTPSNLRIEVTIIVQQ